MAQARLRNEIQTNREVGGFRREGLRPALDLRPFARVLVLEAGHGVARRVGVLADALALICERQAREPARLEQARAERRRQKLERHRIAALRDGEDMAPMGREDLKALAAADAVEAKAVKGKRGAPSIRATAGRMRDGVQAKRVAAHERRAADLRFGQTVALDAAREGEAEADVVERKRGVGQVRLRTRDGLKLLHERGGLGPVGSIEADRLLAIGLRYRDLFELAQSSIKSCLEISEGKRPKQSNMWSQAMAARRRAGLSGQVRRMEATVAVALGSEAVETLRRVAGEGRTITSLTTKRWPRQKMAAQLADALTILLSTSARGLTDTA